MADFSKKAYKIRQIAAISIFILALAAISGIFYPVKIFDIQLAPLIQRVMVDFSIITLTTLTAIVLFTLIFGRFYCSSICPFDIFQELAANSINKKIKIKNKFTKSYVFKYFIAAIAFGFLFALNATVLRYIEPYTIFASALTGSITGIILLTCVLILVVFKNRFFCSNICPVGAILGLLSKISLFKIYQNKENCVSCKMCEKNCPTGSINIDEKIINNETCIKCLKCISKCPKGAMRYGKAPKKEIKFNLKRRQFIIAAMAVGLFGGVIKTGLLIKDKIVKNFKDIILPPGAISQEDILNKCFNCNLCVSNCPNKIIKKADDKFSTIYIDYDEKGFCDKNCNKCSQVCPTGAIKRLTLEEKQKTRIAMAILDENKCKNCKKCDIRCPFGAITKEKDKPPMINAAKCIGCANCKALCKHNAINIYAVKKQSLV